MAEARRDPPPESAAASDVTVAPKTTETGASGGLAPAPQRDRLRGRSPDRPAERGSLRPGRCANHAGVTATASCDRCNLPLCLSCAVPVRGSVFGPECLPFVLEEVPPTELPRALTLPRGDLLAVLGFGLVVALSVLPWSRFGDASGTLQAWTIHWSLLAVGAGAVGLVVAVAFWRRPRDPRLEVATYLAAAAIVALAAYLHHRHPPSLSTPTAAPLAALVGAVIAAVGAGMKAAAMLRTRWARP